ncbi:hypothetical protein PT7_1792 [Pusillimonas sp. T7-7]|jgi:hypothetical protein|uniref:Uncharacterized protein n=1 Tax=Allopusillimonas soli TaxID=659016 RepID=A0A853F9Q5_9BURK|nr:MULTISPECIES: hypothetical protein [Alcaligenaceae]AEC20332.1 hypothetical protein PT7_1792 [Pusillimonas sp. T7-7]NYT36342.1 hypothetical protein [Allopusillimonas soli]NYT60570.1 hypothetical protein [Alcaligenaceae bacterium]
MNLDLTKLAHEVCRCHEQGKSWRLPPMTVRELGILAHLLDGAFIQASASTLLH